MAPESLPRVHETRLDGTVLLVSLALSITTGIVFGLAPAWFAARLNVSAALKQGSANATEGGARHRLRRALVVLEIAAALVLLVGAGLLTRSFLQLARLGPGFDLENATALHLALPQNRYPAPEQRIAFEEMLLAVRSRVAGAYVMPPLERYELALEVAHVVVAEAFGFAPSKAGAVDDAGAIVLVEDDHIPEPRMVNASSTHSRKGPVQARSPHASTQVCLHLPVLRFRHTSGSISTTCGVACGKAI